MRPGVPLMHMHGKQKQMQRLEIYQRFLTSKHAVMFATDVAARGLDFPAIDWVVQVDAPEDVDTYIHRVGRTARYQAKGKALLFLLPSEEEGMLRRLAAKKIEVNKIKANEKKKQSIRSQLQSAAFQFPEIKFLAQRVRVSAPLFSALRPSAGPYASTAPYMMNTTLVIYICYFRGTIFPYENINLSTKIADPWCRRARVFPRGPQTNSYPFARQHTDPPFCVRVR
jgi:hypothetical protein